MPFKYAINQPYRVELVFAWGTLTLDDVVSHRAAITADPCFQPNFSQLIDFTSLDTMQISQGEIDRLSRPHMFSAESRRAFLVGSDLQFGLARMFKTYGELNDGVRNLLISRELGEAAAWAGVPLEIARITLSDLRAEPRSA